MGLLPSFPDASEDRLRCFLILHQFRIARSQGHVRFRQHHFHIAKHGLKEWPDARHVGKQRLVLECRHCMADTEPAGQHDSPYGSSSSMERLCPYVSISVVTESLTQNYIQCIFSTDIFTE